MKIVASRAMIASCALLVGLTVGGVAEGKIISLSEQRYSGLVIQRWDTSCGAAALATVLSYTLGFPVSERTVVSGLLRQTDPLTVKYRGGFSLLDMKRYAQSIGFVGTGMKGLSLSQLLDLQSPIVPINAKGSEHFVVVKGQEAEGNLLIGDPAFGNIKMSPEKFLRVWQGQMAFVVSANESDQQ